MKNYNYDQLRVEVEEALTDAMNEGRPDRAADRIFDYVSTITAPDNDEMSIFRGPLFASEIGFSMCHNIANVAFYCCKQEQEMQSIIRHNGDLYEYICSRHNFCKEESEEDYDPKKDNCIRHYLSTNKSPDTVSVNSIPSIGSIMDDIINIATELLYDHSLNLLKDYEGNTELDEELDDLISCYSEDAEYYRRFAGGKATLFCNIYFGGDTLFFDMIYGSIMAADEILSKCIKEKRFITDKDLFEYVYSRTKVPDGTRLENKDAISLYNMIKYICNDIQSMIKRISEKENWLSDNEKSDNSTDSQDSKAEFDMDSVKRQFINKYYIYDYKYKEDYDGIMKIIDNYVDFFRERINYISNCILNGYIDSVFFKKPVYNIDDELIKLKYSHFINIFINDITESIYELKSSKSIRFINMVLLDDFKDTYYSAIKFILRQRADYLFKYDLEYRLKDNYEFFISILYMPDKNRIEEPRHIQKNIESRLYSVIKSSIKEDAEDMLIFVNKVLDGVQHHAKNTLSFLNFYETKAKELSGAQCAAFASSIIGYLKSPSVGKNIEEDE